MPFLLRVEELDAITAAIERARAKPIPWEVLKPRAVDDPGPFLTLADRKPGARPQSEMVELPFGYRLAISFEYQPAGLCLHISMSSPTPDRSVPNEHAIGMVAQACGMEWPAGDNSRVWIEDFMVARRRVGKAVNLIQVMELAQ